VEELQGLQNGKNTGSNDTRPCTNL